MRRYGFATLILIGSIQAAVEAQETIAVGELLSSDLETAQVKLTYLGPQTKSIPTIVLTVDGHPVKWEAFAPWHHPEHGNDEIYQRFKGDQPSLSVSVGELRAVIQNLKQVTDEINRTVSDLPIVPWVSCTVTVGTPGQVKGVEFTFDHHSAGELFVLMRGSLRADPKDATLMEGQSNLDAMRTLQGWGCALGLLPQAIPARDVSKQVRVTTRGLQLNRKTHRFETTATLTNVSDQEIQGPVAVVILPGVNVSLANAHGTTCVTSPSGREFLNVPMPAPLLRPQESLEVTLEFNHEEGTPITFTTKVLAGVGER